MTTTLEIPAEVIPDARRALFARLGDATEAISQALTQRDHELYPECFVEDRDLFQQVCATLDVVGCDGSLGPQAATIDLAVHGETLRVALECYLPLVENWRDESAPDHDPPPTPADGAKHSELAERVRAMRALISLLPTPGPRLVEVPAEVVPDVRVALLARLGDIAEEISRAVADPECGVDPECFRECRERFEHTCAALDSIGEQVGASTQQP